MWSSISTCLLGRVPMQRFTLFALAILMALLTAIAATPPATSAQTAAPMATWSGENVEYKGLGFTKSEDPENDENIPDFSQSPCINAPHMFYSPSVTMREGVSLTQSPIGTQKSDETAYHWLYAICLSAGFDGSDKTQATPAMLLEYRIPLDQYDPLVDDPGKFNERLDIPITIAPEGTDAFGNRVATETEERSSCTGIGTEGIGWIICPMTTWMANGMDAMFGVLESFLTVAPLATDRTGAHYYMWEIARNFANILFIIGFLLIIYSQITNYGLSNYGLKRLLPRLIIAAILVNISYWICAVALDISNVFGTSLQDLFMDIAYRIPQNSTTDVVTEDISWHAMAGAVLSGGTLAFVAAGAAAGVVASAGASLWFLLVGLATAMVSVLVAILIMAVRQALITILIIIAPLAFVAYLLPSTEKYFDRWRSIFMTLLLVFPILSVVFGGAQLAGLAIIYGASPTSPNYYNMIILGMLVQIAPLIITPLLIKLSGSVVGRIVGMVNDPNKGVIDRTRKFAQNRHDMTKNRQLWDRDANGFRNNNLLAKGGRRNALREENNASKLKAWQGGAHAAYEEDDRSHEVYNQNALNEMIKTKGESYAKAHFSRDIASNDALRVLYYEQQKNAESAETASKSVKTMYEGLKANPSVVSGGNSDEQKIGKSAQELDREARSLASREATAKHVQERDYNKRVTDSTETTLREFAGFQEIDKQGVARIVNIAQEAESKSYASLVDAGQRALQREEATLVELDEIIKNGTSSNPKFAHFSGDLESYVAAVRQYMDTAPMRMRHDMAASIDLSSKALRGTDAGVIRAELAGALRKNKPFHISQTFLKEMEEGNLNAIYNGVSGRNEMILDTLNKFAFDAEQMVNIDQDDIGAIADFFNSPEAAGLNADARKQITNALEKAFDVNDRYAGRMGKRRYNLNKVRTSLGLNEIKQ